MIFAAMSEAADRGELVLVPDGFWRRLGFALVAEEKGVNVWEARPGWSGAPTATPGTA